MITDELYKVLMSIGGICAAVGGLIALPTYYSLHIPEQAGAALALTAGVAIIVANVIRANWPSHEEDASS